MLSLRDFPRWLLLAILVFAPWAFGCTRPWSKELLTWLLLILAGLFAATLVVERRLPQIPRLPAVLCLLVLALGWLMLGNPRATFDPVGPKFHDLPGWVSALPGTMDQGWSLPRMLLITGLLGAFVVAGDMMGNAVWRERLWLVVALVGVSIIVLGLAQRLSGARAIFWLWGTNTGRNFFATYRYHANAGAFINLVLPFIIARAALTFRRETRSGVRAFWCLSGMVAAAAAFVNTSRAAMVITGLLLVVMAVWQVVDWRRRRQGRWELWLSLAAICVAIVSLAVTFGVDRSQKRWGGGVDALAENLRFEVYDIIWKQTLPASGWRGFGPGTFEITFPLSIKEAENPRVGRWLWRYSHQDYLQTVVEWGWIGSVLWFVFLGGGFFYGVFRLLKNYDTLPIESRFLLGAACLALLGIFLHALVDFPLQIASLQLYTAVILALAWSCGGWSARRKRRQRGPEAAADSP